jgi:hypothetical protein
LCVVCCLLSGMSIQAASQQTTITSQLTNHQ